MAPIVIHYPQVMAGTSTMNGDPIFQGATVSVTDNRVCFEAAAAVLLPPCGELNLVRLEYAVMMAVASPGLTE